jgi:MFS family permease
LTFPYFDEMNLSFSQLIRQNRNFRMLLWGQYISELGNWFNFVAGLGLIRVVTKASPEAAGILLFWRTLPFALLMPLAGAVADRYSRKTVLIMTDVLRAAIALLFLLVVDADGLWIAYAAAMMLSGATAFFDGAKNAAVPNIAGNEGLLSATALMFSTRFILMAVGAALGGVAALLFGYKLAFLINSLSFLLSAVFIWVIPAESMRERIVERRRLEDVKRGFDALVAIISDFRREIAEGITYTFKNRFALTILLLNIIWAMGGGATNIVFEGLGVSVFSKDGYSPDFVYAALLTANGIGLSVGVLIAHRVGVFVEHRGIARSYMGWAIIAHGVLFAIAGFMPVLWLVAVFVIVSRVLIAAEYTVQETMFQRSLPDHIRARISTFDRGTEITMYSVSAYLSGLALTRYTAQSVTMIAGLLAASAGIVWFLRTRKPGSYGRITTEESEAV